MFAEHIRRYFVTRGERTERNENCIKDLITDVNFNRMKLNFKMI